MSARLLTGARATAACVAARRCGHRRSRAWRSSQQGDGGWRVDFASSSPMAELEWRGYITVHAVSLLRARLRFVSWLTARPMLVVSPQRSRVDVCADTTGARR